MNRRQYSVNILKTAYITLVPIVSLFHVPKDTLVKRIDYSCATSKLTNNLSWSIINTIAFLIVQNCVLIHANVFSMFPSRFRWTIKGKEEKGGNTQDGWEKCTHAKYGSSKIDLNFAALTHSLPMKTLSIAWV